MVVVRSRAEVLRALDGSSSAPDSVLARCIAAVRAADRDGWVWSAEPAAELAAELDYKIRHGTSRGQTYLGAGEMLARLAALGDRGIALVYAEQRGQTFWVYCDTETGEPLAALIIGPDPDGS